MTRRRRPAGRSAPSLEHYYERIQGWFNFRRVYEELVARAVRETLGAVALHGENGWTIWMKEIG